MSTDTQTDQTEAGLERRRIIVYRTGEPETAALVRFDARLGFYHA